MDSTSRVYEFGEFRLDPARRLLARRNGEPVAITAKAFDALVYLVENAGTLVTRRDLARALWPTTVVEDNNLTQAVLALRRAIGDTQDAPRFVATVPRRGYQFIAEVRQVAREPADDAADGHDSSRAPQAIPASANPVPAHNLAVRATPQLIAATIGVVAVVLLGGWFALQAARSHAPQATAVVNGVTLRPSIAVLPFQNLSPIEEHAYFAAGMHEEVLSRLGRVRGLEVKGRTSVLSYADGSTPLSAIVRDLGVAWVLEGTVRYAAERVRVTVRLVEGATGTERWSETYDAALGDVFAIQGDVATRIAEELAETLTPEERSSLAAAATDSLEAYALYLQAIALYRAHGGIGVSVPTAVRETLIRHLDGALELDPEFAAALGWRAHVLLDALMFDSWAPSDWPQTHARIPRKNRGGRQFQAFMAAPFLVGFPFTVRRACAPTS